MEYDLARMVIGFLVCLGITYLGSLFIVAIQVKRLTTRR